MKKTQTLLLIGLFEAISTLGFKAQVGIGTVNPDPSAILDLNVSSLPANNKKGFLMARVALKNNIDTSTILSPAVGLIVYNTNQTSGTNRVFANSLYMWNGSLWDEYPSNSSYIERVAPNDFIEKSTADYQLNTTSSPSLANYNTGMFAPIPWEASSVIISNPTVTELNSDLVSFDIKKSGYYDISGFINYSPNISGTSSSTGLELILQLSANGGGSWQNLISVNSTYEKIAVQTSQTITIPFVMLPLQQGNKIRFVLSKPTGTTNHGNNAGIVLNSGVSSKSFRISFLKN